MYTEKYNIAYYVVKIYAVVVNLFMILILQVDGTKPELRE